MSLSLFFFLIDENICGVQLESVLIFQRRITPLISFYILDFRTRSFAREEKALVGYLESAPQPAWLESCYEAEGPIFQCTLSLLLLSPARWTQLRLAHLRRLIVTAHQRHVSPSSPSKTLSDTTVKEYAVYKSALIFYGLVDSIYSNLLKVSLHPRSFI